MDDLDFATVIADLHRIAEWLACDIDNDEAQGAASDLNAISEWLVVNRVDEYTEQRQAGLSEGF